MCVNVHCVFIGVCWWLVCVFTTGLQLWHLFKGVLCVFVCASMWTQHLLTLFFLQAEVIFHMKHSASFVCVCVFVKEPTKVTSAAVFNQTFMLLQNTLTHTRWVFPSTRPTLVWTFTPFSYPLKAPLGETSRSFHVQLLFIFSVRAAQSAVVWVHSGDPPWKY